MSVKAARCPRNLGTEGRRFWREITSQVASDGLELDRKELELLRAAAAEADQLARIEAALVDEPPVVKGAQGQAVAHPLIGEARRSRQAIASLLRQVSMQPPSEVTGSGSRTTSTQARAAAMARNLP